MSDENMNYEQRCVELEKSVADWKAEAERWRKLACGKQCAVEKVHPEKSVLSAWKNYDHTAEIEAVRDEMERTQKVISEKERELERMKLRSGIRSVQESEEWCGSVPDNLGRSQEVTETVADLKRKLQEKEAKKIIEEIFADLPENEACGDEVEVKPNVVINIYL